MVSEIKDDGHNCSDCKHPMQRKKGKNGFFWGCTNYPNCMSTMHDVNGEPVAIKQFELSEYYCPLCGYQKLVKRKGKKSFFWGCSGYPKCKGLYWNKDNNPYFGTPQEY